MFLLSFPTFYDFDVLFFFHIFLFNPFAVPFFFLSSLSQIGVFFPLISILANLSDLLSNYDLFLPISSCFFSIQKRPFAISFRVSLVLLYSFSFCSSEKLLISPIINDNLTGQSILGCRFFPFKTFEYIFLLPSALQCFCREIS